MDEFRNAAMAKPRKKTKTIKKKTLIKIPPKDYISELPDCLLHHILSFLPSTKLAVKTCTLSKRWQHLWTHLPNLIFPRDDFLILDTTRKYNLIELDSMFFESRFFVIDSINKTLTHHSSPKIDKFCIQFQDNVLDTMRCPMDSWLSVALQKNVEDLTLDWDEFGEIVEVGDCKGYVLPEYVYQNSHLVRVKVNLCDFNPKGRISWRSLKELSIGYANMSDELIRNVLEGTPVLHSLRLIGCSAIFNIDLSRNTHLKVLVIDDHYTSVDDEYPLKLVGPYLEDLEILGYWSDDDLILKNMSCLVRVTLDLRQGTPDNEGEGEFLERWQITMKELLENVYHAEELKLGDWCVQVISTWKLDVKPSLSANRKCIILNICILDEECFPGIASLLYSSHKLEQLEINFSPNHNTVEFCGTLKPFLFNHITEYYWESHKGTYNCLELHLKTVEISGLANDICNVYIFEFLRFLLENAKVLERLVILNSSQKGNDVVKMTNKLMTLPRCSPCKVLLLTKQCEDAIAKD